MAREFAQVKVAIWQDEKFRELTRDAQHLYFELMTSSTLSYCGVADWRPNRMAVHSAGTTEQEIRRAADELAANLYVVVDTSTEEILVRSFIRNDGLMKQPKMAVSVAYAYAAAASKTLRGVVIHELVRLHQDFPSLPGWGRPQAQELLSMSAIDPADLPRPETPVGGWFRGPVTPNSEELTPAVRGPVLLTPSPAPSPSDKLRAEFVEFWECYPKKVAKDAAVRAWNKAIKRTPIERIQDGVRRFATDPNLPDRQFIPDPATWLNAGRWDDEPLPMRLPVGGRPRAVSGGGGGDDGPRWEGF